MVVPTAEQREALRAPAKEVPKVGARAIARSHEGARATNSEATYFCNYRPNIFRNDPPPPASGSSFAVAKAINGYPLARAGRGSGLYEAGQARALRDGLIAGKDSVTSRAEIGFQANFSGFPSNTRVQFWFNPMASGRASTQSTVNPWTALSTGEVQGLIESGAGRGTEIAYQTFLDYRFSNNSGSAQTSPSWWWPGAANGGFYLREIQYGGGASYTFTIRSSISATAISNFAGSASAAIDFGSGLLDTPANLSPYNYFIAPNANSLSGQPYPHLTVAFITPYPMSVSC